MDKSQLVEWRKKNGYTQIELAAILRVKNNTVSRWENGTRKIPSFLELTLSCIDKKIHKELTDAEVRKILAKELKAKGLSLTAADITDELVEMKRDELRGKNILKAYTAFLKESGHTAPQGKEVKKRYGRKDSNTKNR